MTDRCLYRASNAVLILCFVFITGACATLKEPAFWGALTSELTGSFPAYPELLVFGGRNHDVFLGCLNCSEFDGDSLLNEYGVHGSVYSPNSILNPYGRYGSQYSTDSACNTYASNPPIVVDREGNAYGHLTVNQFNYQIRYSAVVAWLQEKCVN